MRQHVSEPSRRREAADVAGLRFSNLRGLELKGLLDPIELVTIDWA